jgi:hypothetical protein
VRASLHTPPSTWLPSFASQPRAIRGGCATNNFAATRVIVNGSSQHRPLTGNFSAAAARTD